MSEYGDLDFDDAWYNRPIERYLAHKRDVDGITDARLSDIRLAVVETPPETDWQAWDELIDWREGMTADDGWRFLRQLEAAGLGDGTIQERLEAVRSFLDELMARNVVSANPVAYVLDEWECDPDDAATIDRSIDEVGSFLGSILDPQMRAIGVLLAKTGIRNGELINQDLPHLHLDHQAFYRLLEWHDISLHEAVADRPDTLYIPAEPTVGEPYRGERRVAGNKRKRSTRIPLDTECKRALIDWLAVRPITQHPHPLWTSPEGRAPSRLGVNAPRKGLTTYWAEETGFVDDGSTPALTPHWFRHFFTTNMQPGRGYHDDSIPPTLVKYLRGDVGTATDTSGTDIMDVYSHDWGDQVRRQYLDAIYQFGIYD